MKKSAKLSRTKGRRQIAEFEARLASPTTSKLQEAIAAINKKTARARAELETARGRTMTEDQRADEHGQKIWRAYWAEVAESIRSGELTKFSESVNSFGPRVFIEPEVQHVLRDLWLRTLKDETARKILRKICPPLAALDPYRPPKLTERQIEEKERASDKEYRQDKRALEYCDALWCEYQIQTRDVKDRSKRKAVAENIIAAHSRGGEAKRKGIRFFRKKVEDDTTPQTVERK
jgi:hypothetical protein